MAAFLYIAALALAAASVSVLGAAFSVSGLMKLFSGAAVAVAMMASALEFSKLVAAAFLHRTWAKLNILYRAYLLTAVIVLSAITSMGIFGFLSDAYQSSSKDLAANTIKIEALKAEQTRNLDEIARLNRNIEEIPADRISKKLKARKEAEPLIQELTRKSDLIAKEIEQASLVNLDVKSKVGPLIYIARVFNQDIDTIVKWLILVFVSVFDPLAICLVIATSEALKLKSQGHLSGHAFVELPTATPEPSAEAAVAQPLPQDPPVRMRFLDDAPPKTEPETEKVG
jgi:hypothetical protein